MSLPVLIARSSLIALMIHVRKTPTQDDPTAQTGCRSATPHSVAPACRTPCPAPVWWFERCAQNPIPSRTRPLNAPAPMVLCLKTRESRSPPDLHRTRPNHSLSTIAAPERPPSGAAFLAFGGLSVRPCVRWGMALRTADGPPPGCPQNPDQACGQSTFRTGSLRTVHLEHVR